nr:uncharacterized protein LOC119165549 [Rhipicephalus microplus]
MKREIVVIIFTIFSTNVPIATPNRTRPSMSLDIKQFVDTSQRIWTYETTNRTHVRCEVDKRESISRLSITFQRSCLIDERRCDMQIQGIFDTFYKRRMTLFHRDIFRSVETLLFLASDYSCAVLKIESLSDWDVIRYDLRVRNSVVRRKPNKSCRNFYNRIIKYQPFLTLYTADCQWVVAPFK